MHCGDLDIGLIGWDVIWCVDILVRGVKELTI